MIQYQEYFDYNKQTNKLLYLIKRLENFLARRGKLICFILVSTFPLLLVLLWDIALRLWVIYGNNNNINFNL